MKKTLLGVLAFVLVLATVLTGTVLAADEEVSADPQKVADVQKVGADNPIKVDGYMDQAYTNATPLEMTTYSKTAAEIYTHGIARFVWSEAENALYCFMIINDADVGPYKYDTAYKEYTPWVGDTVELFVDFTGATGAASTIPAGWGLTEGTTMKRGLQYRIDGHTGNASCYLQEDAANYKTVNPTWKDPESGQGFHDCYATYHWDDAAGAFRNSYDSLLTTNQNVFGWEKSDDLTKNGWARQRTEFGYTLEFRIEATSTTTPLAAGQNVKFDIQANDSWEATRGNTTAPFFYNSTRRVATGESTAAGNTAYYDWLTLVDEEADNSGDAYSLAKLEDFGMADATTSKPQATTPREIIKTNKKTWTRKPTSAVTQATNTTAPVNTTKPAGGDTEEPAGGCGSSITVGASVAAVALVGAAGFFAFRKKDEE